MELEEELLAAVCDMLPALASAVGPDAYAPVFAADHLPHLLTRCGQGPRVSLCTSYCLIGMAASH